MRRGTVRRDRNAGKAYLMVCFATLCWSLYIAGHLFAQATSGVILGRITDPQGAAVPNALITAKNEGTGLVQSTQTSVEGDFTLKNLPVGSYMLTVTKEGFKVISRSKLQLQVDQKMRVDLELSLGEVSDVIDVIGATPILQTQSVETGQVIQSRQIVDLPLLGRDFLNLTYLIPGVVSGAGGNNVNIAINGQREFANSIMVDGVEVTANRNNDTGIRPSLESVQEFKALTSAYAPEFGRAAGGVITIQTKSGANQVHGNLYEFLRTNATTARSFFSPTPSGLKQNNFGGSVGGPIIKDKTFYFASYEGVRARDKWSWLDSVPTANQIKYLSNGDVDLSGLKDPYTGNQIPIFDPAFYATNYYSQQFPENVIPADRVSPAGRAVLQNFFPAPNRPGILNGWYSNFISQQRYPSTYDNVDTKIDHTFSERNRLAVAYHYSSGNSLIGDRFEGFIPVEGGGDADYSIGTRDGIKVSRWASLIYSKTVG
jgi:carboxypeptidase family protein